MQNRHCQYSKGINIMDAVSCVGSLVCAARAWALVVCGTILYIRRLSVRSKLDVGPRDQGSMDMDAVRHSSRSQW